LQQSIFSKEITKFALPITFKYCPKFLPAAALLASKSFHLKTITISFYEKISN